MAAFELFPTAAGDVRWRLRADNGQIVASPPRGYPGRKAALVPIAAIRAAGRDAFEEYQDERGERRWRLRGTTKKSDLLAVSSEGYRSAAEARRSIEFVLTQAPLAEVIDGTGEPPDDGPEPSVVVPPLDPTIATSVAKSTEFIHAGPNAIQTDVKRGAIDPVRAAVLRGRVLTAEGAPLPDVTVRVLGRTELGRTVTRGNGSYDLVVNGGGPVTLTFTADGRLTVQRTTTIAYGSYVAYSDVVLRPLEGEATPVPLGRKATAVAKGSTAEDEEGARTPVVIVPESTRAKITSGGALKSVTIRATEYTVGATGEDAMPAPLPPTSAFTYAVELAADEAPEDDVDVVFSQPVVHYVENFVGFPVGTAVPTAYYDRKTANWVPTEDGRVVAVVRVEKDGIAKLDIEGNGKAAGAAKLEELGVTEAELRHVAELYAPGQQLWRVPLAHFSPFDCNWPLIGPDDLESPPEPRGPRRRKRKKPCRKGRRRAL